MRALAPLCSVLSVLLLAACGGGGPDNPPTPPPPGNKGPVVWDTAAFPWPMYGQNPRRTHASPFNGPQSYTSTSTRNWQYAAEGGWVVNMEGVADANGMYIGTWGVLRRDASDTPDLWDKSDGRWYGLHWDNRGAAQERFAPSRPSLNHTGYLYPGRPKLQRDVDWCGAGNDYHVSFYNGTIEGTPVIDPRTGLQWVGRGDGKLYAMSPDTGAVVHTFTTFNPQLPDDPDGGGEIVGGPVMAPDGHIYFGTFAAPWPGTPTEPSYETNAAYAVNTEGKLIWRYPAHAASLENILAAPPALSPDGKTMYLGTFGGDVSIAGRLIALDLTKPPTATDVERTKWSVDLRNSDNLINPAVWVRHIAVGLDGTVYVGAAQAAIGGSTTVVFAVKEDSTFAWTPSYTELHAANISLGDWTGGLALEETASETVRVYATTTHQRGLFSNGEGGTLYALDASTGVVQGSFAPSTLATPISGSLAGPTIGADGMIYVGARGLHHHVASGSFVDGAMFGVRFNATTGLFTESWRMPVEGNLDWAHPIIGAQGGLYFGSSARFPLFQELTWYTFGEVTPNRDPWIYGVFE